MELSISSLVILGLSALLFLPLFWIYWNIVRKCVGFPVDHIIPKVIYYQIVNRTLNFNNALFEVLGDMSKKFSKEGLCMTYVTRPKLFIFGEEPIKVFTSEKSATDKNIEYEILAEAMGDGLITSNTQKWKKHRKICNTAFQIGKLKEKIPLFNDYAVALVEDLKTVEGKPTTEIIGFIKHYYFNTLSESIFGVEQSGKFSAENQAFLRIVDTMSGMIVCRMYQPWLRFKLLFNVLPFGRKYRQFIDEGRSFAKNVILEMKKRVASAKESDDTEYFSKNLKNSLAYILLNHHLTDPTFTFEDLQNEVITIMVAGYDTVSYSTNWCLFMLGLYPELQEKAAEEVLSNSGCQNYITYEEMNSFTYLEAFIMETLRLYPTAPIFGRKLSQDVQCGKYTVRKGTSVLFLVYHWHRNPDIYPDPEKFDPDRFLNNEKRKPWTHIPFAEGNRSCLGKKYAIMKMKIFLAHVLRNFKIKSLDKREDVSLSWNIVLSPAKPFRMIITSRESCDTFEANGNI